MIFSKINCVTIAILLDYITHDCYGVVDPEGTMQF